MQHMWAAVWQSGSILWQQGVEGNHVTAAALVCKSEESLRRKEIAGVL